MPFARAVTDMVENMKQTRRGVPELPSVVPPALTTVTAMEWHESPELWEFAQLPQLYEYLRGCKHVQIPEEWKPFFPKNLPEVVGGAP